MLVRVLTSCLLITSVTSECSPANSCTGGHYTCNVNGGISCRLGWEGADCKMRINKEHLAAAKDSTTNLPCQCLHLLQDSELSPFQSCSFKEPSISRQNDLRDCSKDTSGQPQRCHNGGACFLQRCCCGIGYTGKFCEIDINECELTPCLNGGTCTQHLPGYRKCFCPNAWLGENCAIYRWKVECEGRDDCEGHYSCDPVKGHRLCLSGWTGGNCTLPLPGTKVPPECLQSSDVTPKTTSKGSTVMPSTIIVMTFVFLIIARIKL